MNDGIEIVSAVSLVADMVPKCARGCLQAWGREEGCLAIVVSRGEASFEGEKSFSLVNRESKGS